jgi:hypothetical protein
MAADANVVMTHLTSSGITVFVLQWLKNSKYFPWITEEKMWLLRGLSGLAAAGTAVGISTTWNGANHELVIGGLTLTAVVAAVWAFAKQFVMNEMVWQATKSKNGTTPAAPAAPAPKLDPSVFPGSTTPTVVPAGK